MYIFHHIPKTAGLSVNHILRQWFAVVEDYRPGDKRDEEYFRNRINLSSLSDNTCLCGHFELKQNYLHVRYPEVLRDERFKLFTFVRNPLETKISLYYYERKLGQNKDITLGDYLTRGSRGENYIANRFPCSKENYKDVLDRYCFIGISEYSQESIDKLADMFDKPRVKIPILNQSERDEQYSSLPKSVTEEIKVKNELDYLLYEYCLSRFLKMPLQKQ